MASEQSRRRLASAICSWPRHTSPMMVTGVPFWRSFRMAMRRALRYSASFSAYWQPDSLQGFSAASSLSGSSSSSSVSACFYSTFQSGRGQHGLLATNSMYCGMLANW